MPGRTGNIRIVINEGAIERLTAPGGMVYEHAVAIRNDAVAIMRTTAPVQTGALRASIRNAGSLKSGRNQTTARATISAEHAKWVIGGTGIWGPKRKPYGPKDRTTFRRNRHGGWDEVPARLVVKIAGKVVARPLTVRGQRPNDFPSRALREAMRRHGH